MMYLAHFAENGFIILSFHLMFLWLNFALSLYSKILPKFVDSVKFSFPLHIFVDCPKRNPKLGLHEFHIAVRTELTF
jgi:hypothetical protein